MATLESADTLRALEARLGADDTAGLYRDAATDRMVVTVTDEAAAETVRETGAVARLVERSGAELTAAKTTLDRTVHIAGTTWGIDPVADQVLITADSTVKGARLDALKVAAAELGEAARIEYETGRRGGRAAARRCPAQLKCGPVAVRSSAAAFGNPLRTPAHHSQSPRGTRKSTEVRRA
ncbi:S1 family peptidase [Streptomyces sp. NBC_00259]|uniref:S1 family peptidase n=1 Tax=Streptomyces sp. NBC_00259 TaxID=2903643 RepID=UPI002E2C0F46|nr:S1 family peptidase [Streptomyces sp. NBC_00259]